MEIENRTYERNFGDMKRTDASDAVVLGVEWATFFGNALDSLLPAQVIQAQLATN